jgi:hypothetical protein
MDNLRIEKPMLHDSLDGVGYSSPRCPARAALGVCHNERVMVFSGQIAKGW